MSIDVEALAAQEADESESGFFGEIDREAGGRRHGGHDRDAGERSLLGDLEAEPARGEKDRGTGRRLLRIAPMALSVAL